MGRPGSGRRSLPCQGMGWRLSSRPRASAGASAGAERIVSLRRNFPASDSDPDTPEESKEAAL